jgi:ATP-dependent helicase/nuclease subunit B
MPRLLTAHAAGPRIEATRAWLAERGAAGGVLLIGPSQRAADDVVRHGALPGGGLLGVHRSTLSHLAADLSALPLARAGRARLSALGGEAVAARALARTRAEGRLAYFEPVTDAPGFPAALGRTLEDLRLERVAPEALADLGPGGADLARLLAGFEAELAAQGLADYAAILSAAEDAAQAGLHFLTRVPLALLDLYPASPAEQAFLRALVAQAPDALATAPTRDPLRLARMQDILQCAPEALDEGEAPPALDRVRRWVFSPEAPPGGEQDPSLTFFSAPGEARECVEIARQALKEAAAGRPFDRMAVLLRSPRAYQPLLEDALARADIPAFFSRGARRPDPGGRALLALLACAAEGLSASRFAEYLSLGQVPRVDDTGAPAPRAVPWVVPKDERQLVFATVEGLAPAPAPEPEEREGDPVIRGHLEVPLGWEQLLVDAAVIGGHARWTRRLAGLERELRRQVEALAPEGGPRRARKARDLAALANLRRFALPVIARLHDLPAAAPWRTWIERLEHLASQTLRTPEPVLAVLAELRPMGDVGPVGLDEVQAVLTDRLSALTEEPTGSRFGRLFVGTLDEAAGRAFEVVFVPGLAEGVLPQPVFEDPLLLDEARARLRPDLARRPRARQEERARLQLALGAATERALLSYPRLDVAQGRPRVPSFYALDVLRAVAGRVSALGALKRQAAEAADARVGWPAPRAPADAVDDIEYDLAVLGPLAHAPPEAVAGHGHYLVAAAERDPRAATLVRALRAQWMRWDPHWSRADGLVAASDRASQRGAAAEAVPLLAAHRPSARACSPTALQHYAVCPYRFYLHAVLHLRPREAPAPLQALDPLTRGSLFHQVQFELFQRLEAARLLPVTPGGVDEVLEHLDAVLQFVLPAAEDELAPAIHAVWQRETAALRLELRRWVREVAVRDTGWLPIRAELAFGLGDEDEARDRRSVAEAVRLLGRYPVRGSIDLVERKMDGATLRVTDHKTGKAPDELPLSVGGGEHLQPLIYGLAAQAILQAPVTSGRLYYCTERGQHRVVEIPVDDDTAKDLGQVFETVDAALAEGFLPAAPRAKGCDYCEYRLACGPQEVLRSRRKGQERLAPLLHLRSRP